MRAAHEGPTGPLTEEHLLALQQSEARFRKLQGALRYAGFNGSTMLLFGGISILTGIGSWPAMIVGASLLAGGALELHHRNALRRLDPSALPRLAINQLIVGAAAAGYCVFQALFPAPNEIAAELEKAGAGGAIDVQGITQSMQALATLVYLGMAVVVGFFQLIAAGYYLSKRSHLKRYLAESPAWVHDLQRRGLLKAA